MIDTSPSKLIWTSSKSDRQLDLADIILNRSESYRQANDDDAAPLIEFIRANGGSVGAGSMSSFYASGHSKIPNLKAFVEAHPALKWDRRSNGEMSCTSLMHYTS